MSIKRFITTKKEMQTKRSELDIVKNLNTKLFAQSTARLVLPIKFHHKTENNMPNTSPKLAECHRSAEENLN